MVAHAGQKPHPDGVVVNRSFVYGLSHYGACRLSSVSPPLLTLLPPPPQLRSTIGCQKIKSNRRLCAHAGVVSQFPERLTTHLQVTSHIIHQSKKTRCCCCSCRACDGLVWVGATAGETSRTAASGSKGGRHAGVVPRSKRVRCGTLRPLHNVVKLRCPRQQRSSQCPIWSNCAFTLYELHQRWA